MFTETKALTIEVVNEDMMTMLYQIENINKEIYIHYF